MALGHTDPEAAPAAAAAAAAADEVEEIQQQQQQLHLLRDPSHTAIDYCPEACEHKCEEQALAVTFDSRGGARWRSCERFASGGTFTAKIRTPAGDTSGLNTSFYLSTLEGPRDQDEIDFEFLGKDKSIVQTNFYTTGAGGREVVHDLGFDTSLDFHEYTIRWEPNHKIEWLVDGKLIRVEEKREGEEFPSRPSFLYASVWNAGEVDEGRWAGPYLGTHEPYVSIYKDVQVPDFTAKSSAAAA